MEMSEHESLNAERLSRIRLTHAYRGHHGPPDEPELFFLLRMLDASDEALRAARAEVEHLWEVAEAARKWNSERIKMFTEDHNSTASFVTAERELIRVVTALWALKP